MRNKRAEDEIDDEVDTFEPEQTAGEVVTLPNYSAIPEPTIPLDPGGRNVYDTWCRNLIEIGQLTAISVAYVESLALATDEIATAKRKERSLRGPMEMRRSATLKLERYIGNKTVEGPGLGENPFSAFGFAKRARQRRHPHD